MIYVGLGILAIWLLAAFAGVGKNTVFRNPQSMTDAQIETTIRLSRRIIDDSKLGSKAYAESSAKFSAAFREQCRRRRVPYPIAAGDEAPPELPA